MLARGGATRHPVRKYNSLYREAAEYAKGATSRVSRKKYGYMRSDDLATKGQWLMVAKQLLHCHQRNAPKTPALNKEAEASRIDLDSMTCQSKRSPQRGEAERK